MTTKTNTHPITLTVSTKDRGLLFLDADLADLTRWCRSAKVASDLIRMVKDPENYANVIDCTQLTQCRGIGIKTERAITHIVATKGVPHSQRTKEMVMNRDEAVDTMLNKGGAVKKQKQTQTTETKEVTMTDAEKFVVWMESKKFFKADDGKTQLRAADSIKEFMKSAILSVTRKDDFLKVEFDTKSDRTQRIWVMKRIAKGFPWHRLMSGQSGFHAVVVKAPKKAS